MNISTKRWIPAIAVPVIVVAGAVAIPAMADTSVSLPTKSASQVVDLATKSAGVSFTGSLSSTANLGLPSISSAELGGSSSSTSSIQSTLALLTGTHTAKVFVDGTSAFRVQTLDDLAERDVIRKGTSVWSYDSQNKTATHLTLPASTGGATNSQNEQAQSPAAGVPQTPAQVVSSVLANVEKYTEVTTASNVSVAGQKAYEVVLTPKHDATTLVGRVTLAVDSVTGVPLKASISAVGASSPAYEVGFTSISYTTPSPSTFEFTAPKGTSVTNVTVPSHHSTQAHPGALTQQSAVDQAQKRAKGEAALAKYSPTVLGSGWSTILEATLPADSTSGLSGSRASGSGSGSGSGSTSALLDSVLTKVDGGRVLQTALLSVYLTDGGKVLIGAVPASTLEAAATK